MNEQFKKQKCGECGQTKGYLISIDRGTVDLVRAIANKISQKGINVVHVRKEIEGHGLTSNQVGNLTRPRAHGLIARVRGEPGNYCLTTKGAEFLRGKPVHKYAIRDKTSHGTTGYYGDEMVTIKDLMDGAYWESPGFRIEEGRIIHDIQPTLL